ncbi:MAG: hypothetical protein A2V88_13055 [Elusimicrobia bacterium RBG_16_66_12]|nr:MAG: hypothetical protein A2V88_13055 [Elusimicrobia bacterium RBG_16_66_12]
MPNAAREQTTPRLPYVWDYDIDESQFRALLAGELRLGRLDQRWAAVRLLEYAPYREIIRLLGFRRLVAGWPLWRRYVRSPGRQRGLDFLVEWLPAHHPELL